MSPQFEDIKKDLKCPLAPSRERVRLRAHMPCPPQRVSLCSEEPFVCSVLAGQGRTLLLGQKPAWGWEGLALQALWRTGSTEAGLAPQVDGPVCSIKSSSSASDTGHCLSKSTKCCSFTLSHGQWGLGSPSSLAQCSGVRTQTPGQHLLFAGCVMQRLLRASERE